MMKSRQIYGFTVLIATACLLFSGCSGSNVDEAAEQAVAAQQIEEQAQAKATADTNAKADANAKLDAKAKAAANAKASVKAIAEAKKKKQAAIQAAAENVVIDVRHVPVRVKEGANVFWLNGNRLRTKVRADVLPELKQLLAPLQVKESVSHPALANLQIHLESSFVTGLYGTNEDSWTGASVSIHATGAFQSLTTKQAFKIGETGEVDIRGAQEKLDEWIEAAQAKAVSDLTQYLTQAITPQIKAKLLEDLEKARAKHGANAPP